MQTLLRGNHTPCLLAQLLEIGDAAEKLIQINEESTGMGTDLEHPPPIQGYMPRKEISLPFILIVLI